MLNLNNKHRNPNDFFARFLASFEYMNKIASKLTLQLLSLFIYTSILILQYLLCISWSSFAALALFEHVNLVYGTISEFCTQSGCADMTGPGNR